MRVYQECTRLSLHFHMPQRAINQIGTALKIQHTAHHSLSAMCVGTQDHHSLRLLVTLDEITAARLLDMCGNHG
jgi:hypothetical protein